MSKEGSAFSVFSRSFDGKAAYIHMIKYLSNRQIYEDVVIDAIPKARDSVWIATSDLKDMYVSFHQDMVPFLAVLADLLKRGISVRLIHAKEPGENFRKDFDTFPILFSELERLLCPRVHLKAVIIDGFLCYTGSANVTGAGMGSKGLDKRNFENGIFTDDPQLVQPLIQQFDDIWMGMHCKTCKRREYCTDCPLL